MNATISLLHEQPFTVLNAFSGISDNELIDSGVIVRPGARALFSWWSDYVARHDRLPTRNSFDILNMLPHAAHMFLAARLPDDGWSYQLQGEEFKRLYNGGFEQDSVTRTSFAAFSKSVPEYLDIVARNRKCRRSFGKLARGPRNRDTFESIDCPLIDNYGNVSHVIGIAEIFRGADEWAAA